MRRCCDNNTAPLSACKSRSMIWRTKLQMNWRKLNKEIALMSEDQVLDLLNQERAGAKRISILERLHQRYTAMRTARERMELLKEARAL